MSTCVTGPERGGGEGPDPEISLLLHENPTPRTFLDRFPEFLFLFPKTIQ